MIDSKSLILCKCVYALHKIKLLNKHATYVHVKHLFLVQKINTEVDTFAEFYCFHWQDFI